jgi:UDPglucose 6-dehydrogenase
MDFNYDYLEKALTDIVAIIRDNELDGKIISIISTVLPGTTRDRLYPAMQQVHNEGYHVLYNPSFIAMGRTIEDFENPEFTLIGGNDFPASLKLVNFYYTIHKKPILFMTWTEAESVKVLYNTYIGTKIMFANTVMEMCHKLGANCDVVTDALKHATDRLISPYYLSGGMGDGGGCHPRDNIALAYHSDRLGLSYNLFDYVMTVREKQCEWKADLIEQHRERKRQTSGRHDYPVIIMGATYKPGTNLTYGSPSLLLAHILKERGIHPIIYDHTADMDASFSESIHDELTIEAELPSVPGVYLIGTQWPSFKTYPYPEGSVVIDPWGWIDEVPDGVELVSIGRG